MTGETNYDPEGLIFTEIGEVTVTDDGAPDYNPTEYEGIDNFWYCIERNSERDEYFSAYCNLFMPKHDAAENTNAQLRFTGECTDCTLHYIGYNGMGGDPSTPVYAKISPAISTLTWMHAASGIVAAGTAALASLLLI